jgi:hypothetical protein
VARLKTRVTVEGVAETMAGLRDPQMLAEPMRELLTSAARVGQRAATDNIDGGLGIAVRSIGSRIGPEQARVFSAMPTARSRSIDQGRKPGQPLKSLLPGIIRWKEAVGHPDAAIVIAKGIQRRGAKGRFFKRAAVEAVNNALPALFGAVRAGASRWWNRRIV